MKGSKVYGIYTYCTFQVWWVGHYCYLDRLLGVVVISLQTHPQVILHITSTLNHTQGDIFKIPHPITSIPLLPIPFSLDAKYNVMYLSFRSGARVYLLCVETIYMSDPTCLTLHVWPYITFVYILLLVSMAHPCPSLTSCLFYDVLWIHRTEIVIPWIHVHHPTDYSHSVYMSWTVLWTPSVFYMTVHSLWTLLTCSVSHGLMG